MSTSEAREAEFRAKIRAGQMESVGRVILFSDIPHPDDNGRYWKVYPAEQITNLTGTHVRPYRAATHQERCQRLNLKYKSGTCWTSRIFARVSSGKE